MVLSLNNMRYNEAADKEKKYNPKEAEVLNDCQRLNNIGPDKGNRPPDDAVFVWPIGDEMIPYYQQGRRPPEEGYKINGLFFDVVRWGHPIPVFSLSHYS